ncbi:hypothetical protein RRG08_053449 [Elysia crispata]|uniref:Uncharacterized protein n=1 Tax=Elysia crispata TaxID=231223 RepID=A0AAE0ZFN8_9GAST|nr:hypothetical protein RRG08_053449 [Elysia crispata]
MTTENRPTLPYFSPRSCSSRRQQTAQAQSLRRFDKLGVTGCAHAHVGSTNVNNEVSTDGQPIMKQRLR